MPVIPFEKHEAGLYDRLVSASAEVRAFTEPSANLLPDGGQCRSLRYSLALTSAVIRLGELAQVLRLNAESPPPSILIPVRWGAARAAYCEAKAILPRAFEAANAADRADELSRVIV